jgi:hypothetical protein
MSERPKPRLAWLKCPFCGPKSCGQFSAVGLQEARRGYSAPIGLPLDLGHSLDLRQIGSNLLGELRSGRTKLSGAVSRCPPSDTAPSRAAALRVCQRSGCPTADSPVY